MHRRKVVLTRFFLGWGGGEGGGEREICCFDEINYAAVFAFNMCAFNLQAFCLRYKLLEILSLIL